MAPLPVAKHQLFLVDLPALAPVLREALLENFADVSVEVIECPDLTAPPFRLAAKGLCGQTRLADVGGVKHLSPTPNLTKKYTLNQVAEAVELPEGCLMIGPGAGSFEEIGANCEYIANAFVSAKEQATNHSQSASLDEAGNPVMTSQSSTNFALMGNFFISLGETGLVLEVKAKSRSGPKNFVSCMREALRQKYPGKVIALGGTFAVKKGDVRMHIMPDFSKTPLSTPQEMDNWLRFFNFPGPLVFMTEFVSEDPGWDLRTEHTHGHSPTDDKGKCIQSHGGHYHDDVTPHDVEYLGYFNIAEFLYRVDQPLVS